MTGSEIDTITLNTWKEVQQYNNDGFLQIPMSYFEHVVQHGNYYPKHAFSSGQLASKSWLLEKLHKVNWRHQPDKDVVAILGCWIGGLVDPLLRTFEIERIYGIDTDADSIEKSERLNRDHVHNKWKYKGVVHDVDMLDCDDMQFQTGGELIRVKPNWIINTSCEHMSTLWYDSVDSDQLIIMQTNNSPEFEGHINICETIDDMSNKYPLSNTLYIGELITPAYTRYMQIGYK